MDTAKTTIDLNDYLEFSNPDAIRIKGHRLDIAHVLKYYLIGYHPDEIVTEFPGLELVKIYAIIAYYLANREYVDAYLRRRRAKDEQAYQEWAANPSPLIQRLRRIRDEQRNYQA
jgi:uncharacterized protein (DUF433 family)